MGAMNPVPSFNGHRSTSAHANGSVTGAERILAPESNDPEVQALMEHGQKANDARRQPSPIDSATLLKRTFGIDLYTCSKCGGKKARHRHHQGWPRHQAGP
jgi:hypothetical protein